MSKRLKVCRRCMERLNSSDEASADLGTYLVATGSGGVELSDEAYCQLRLVCGDKSKPEPRPRSLADVGEIEIESAITTLLKQLDLNSYSQTGARELNTAIKNEWLKALHDRQYPPEV